MMTSEITVERLRDILNYDPLTGTFTWKVRKAKCVRVGGVAGSVDNYGYIRITIDGHTIKAHRLAWLYVHGVWPVRDLDHVDENKSNNRIDNLRLATSSQNHQNQVKPRSDSTSGLRGVSFHRLTNKWQATIQTGGKQQHLGLFTEPELAHRAHLAAKAETHPFWNGEA